MGRQGDPVKEGKAAIKGAGLLVWAPILFCWLAYTSAYLGRYSYSSNITGFLRELGVSHGDTGLVTTCFFFAYGAGQVINGLLCRRYRAKYMIPLALLVSSLLNLAVLLGVPFSWMKYLWLLNGAVQSILWPTLISVLSRTLQKKDLTKAVVAMSTTVPVGTFLIYGLSALLAISGGYRFSFLAASVLMLVSAVVWFLFYEKVFQAEREESGNLPSSAAASASRGIAGGALAAVIALGVFAVANNLVKDGLTTWVPSILKEKFGLPESLSIFLTLLLPLLGLLGAICNTALQKKISSLVFLSGVWFLLTALCMGLVLLFVDTGLWAVVLAAFGCTSLFMHAVNNVITSMAPLYLREQIDSGLLAGLLNGCCYIGSALSSYGLGALADHFGWNGVFLTLLWISCVPVGIAAIFSLFSRKSISGGTVL